MISKRNKKVYVGKTSKLPEIRVKEHNSGVNQWTKGNGPFDLVYYEAYSCSEDAAIRERFYKTGLGREIKRLIVQFVLNNIKHGT